MRKIKVGLLSFSDGRESVHQSLCNYIDDCAKQIKAELEKTGQVDVVTASCVIAGNEDAKKYALELKAQMPDAVIFNVPVFAFPNFSLISATVLKLPILAISNVNAGLPGLGGLQAACNLINQCGYPCEKLWGDLQNAETLESAMRFLRAAYAANELNGQVFGLIGGRSIGMGSGVAPVDRWMQTFGVDVDHMDQSEILRRSAFVDPQKVEHAFTWLNKNTKVDYDGDKLTEESLREQIRHYYATKDICEEKDFAFVGVKCHYELSAYHCTQCLSAAFFNDPYDWDGPKETRVFTCEADAEGGLTMQILKLLSGTPVLFADFRFYDKAKNIFYFCNCGAIATWFSQRSDTPEVNLQGVSLKPIIPKYAGKGCHVQYIAKEGRMTFARLTHDQDKFIFTVFTGTAKELPEAALKDTCEVWPHMFVEADAPYQSIIENFDCNHVHAVYGDYVEEIKLFCQLKNIEFRYIQ
ncbi:MAG: L-fucose isomerase [Angelakisella sp.]|nr:L-fucose isomerase [Angelakisella sp.]